MEVVEEPVAHNPVVGDVQVNMSDETPGIVDDAGKCSQPNGVAEAAAAATVDSDLAPKSLNSESDQNQAPVESIVHHEVISVVTTKVRETISIETVVTNEEPVPDTVHSSGDTVDQEAVQKQSDNGLTSKIADEITELFVGNTENETQNELEQVEESLINEHDTEPRETVTFKTEVLVERNENDGNDPLQNDVKADELDASKNILSALQQNLELSDVLQSDSNDNTENNNSSTRQEVLNKEELLDILEGNVEQADDQFVKIMQVDHTNIKTIEAQLALQQLTRLKSCKPKKTTEKGLRKKKKETRLSQHNSGCEIKTKRDKKMSEPSGVDDSEVVSDENKGKKENKNSSTSKTDLALTRNKSNLKDKKVPDDESEEATSKKDKQQALDNSTNNAECVLSETKPKRSRKAVENTTKASESSVIESKNKRENHKPSLVENDAENSLNDKDGQTEIKKSNSVKENIVNVLVRDWEDDEHESFKDETTEKLLEETEGVVKTVEQLVTAQEVTVEQERIDGSSMDSSASCVSESQALNKSGDESQPQRRLGRVIKKKVIFDPDNPDTFTKGKTITKSKELHKTETEKELPTPKKSKIDIQQVPKSKSPTGKLQWKKPTPKPNKQNKRLTEVDRLLMDEGAVNMIYQLTPEAPKGKKNMRTKAEFIKKIQSSTPEGKEMKFRERKKEVIKVEDAEAKKIVGGKQRGSLSGSVKSMSICEDFEAHSADDSIIYRRHSSSSYSSNCMSPLRGNEPDSSAGPGAARDSPRPSDNLTLSNADDESIDQVSDVFTSEVNTNSPSDVINKSDCLSIKQKLNSKLSHVLNKRKRESAKTDKPAKQKRLSGKHDEIKTSNVKSVDDLGMAKIKTLSVSFDDNLAEICVKRKGDYDIQTLKDLEQALVYVDSKEDVTVTLLTSECGTLCSSLDFRSILEENLETRTLNAFQLAESIRSLLSTVERHSKLLCTGAWGSCSGLGLALAALSDVALASECARFSLDAGAPLALAATALAARLSRPTVEELVLFGRQLSAQEALRGGLLSRVLWPARAAAQLRDAAKDLARQPARSLLLKKQLLTLNRSEKTFQSSLEAERNLVADYWTSAEFQEALRASFEA